MPRTTGQELKENDICQQPYDAHAASGFYVSLLPELVRNSGALSAPRGRAQSPCFLKWAQVRKKVGWSDWPTAIVQCDNLHPIMQSRVATNLSGAGSILPEAPPSNALHLSGPLLSSSLQRSFLCVNAAQAQRNHLSTAKKTGDDISRGSRIVVPYPPPSGIAVERVADVEPFGNWITVAPEPVQASLPAQAEGSAGGRCFAGRDGQSGEVLNQLTSAS